LGLNIKAMDDELGYFGEKQQIYDTLWQFVA
jgi:hypothetical protein